MAPRRGRRQRWYGALAAITLAVVSLGGAPSAQAAAGSTLVYSFGSDNLGFGSEFGDQPTPKKIATLSGVHVAQVSASDNFVLVLSTDGKLYSWGSNSSGGLGDGTTTDRFTPAEIALPKGTARVIKVAASDDFALALTSSGQVLMWGQLFDLPHRPTAEVLRPTPVAMPGGRRAVDISAGGSAAVVTSDGQVYGWGYNEAGQLGIGHYGSPIAHPVRAALPAGFRASAAAVGVNHELVLGSVGGAIKVLSFGDNSSGELGNHVRTHAPQPTPVAVQFPAGVGRIVSIYASFEGSGALNSTGTFYRWGIGDVGANGNGKINVDVLAPTPPSLPAGTIVTAVSMGGFNSLVVTSQNKLFGWGDNSYHALGPNPTEIDPTPIDIAMPVGSVAGASAGFFSSYVVISRP